MIAGASRPGGTGSWYVGRVGGSASRQLNHLTVSTGILLAFQSDGSVWPEHWRRPGGGRAGDRLPREGDRAGRYAAGVRHGPLGRAGAGGRPAGPGDGELSAGGWGRWVGAGAANSCGAPRAAFGLDLDHSHEAVTVVGQPRPGPPACSLSTKASTTWGTGPRTSRRSTRSGRAKDRLHRLGDEARPTPSGVTWAASTMSLP